MLKYKVFLSTQFLILTDTDCVYSVLPTKLTSADKKWPWCTQCNGGHTSGCPLTNPAPILSPANAQCIWSQVLTAKLPLTNTQFPLSSISPTFSFFLSLFLSILCGCGTDAQVVHAQNNLMPCNAAAELMPPEPVGCVFHTGKSSTWNCCSTAQHTAQHRAEPSHCSSGCKVTKTVSSQHKTCLILN